MSNTEIELHSYPAGTYLEQQAGPSNAYKNASRDKSPSGSLHSRKSAGQVLGPATVDGEVPLRKWNESRTMIARIFTSFWCMIVLGLNDGQIGAIIPYVGH